MKKMVFVMNADRNMTVEGLMGINRKMTGKNYLDLDSGDIVHQVEESPKVEESTEETPKKRSKKKD